MNFISNFVNWLSNPQNMIALASFLVAVPTAITVVYQAILARKHNRISVNPYISWTKTIIRKDNIARFTLYCYNRGLGPAIIDKYAFHFDGKRLGGNNSTSDMRELAKNRKRIIEENIDAKISLSWSFDKGEVFEQGSNRIMLQIVVNVTEDADVVSESKYFDFLDRFEATIEYHTLYGEKFKHTYTSDDITMTQA